MKLTVNVTVYSEFFFWIMFTTEFQNGTIIQMDESNGGNVMAGLLQRLARQLFGSEKATSQQTSKTASKPINKANTVTSGSVKTAETAPDANMKVVDRTIKRERTPNNVAREDYLLNQIDEFRERAQKLQDLLLSKESRVEELQNIVDEKEGKAKELQDILEERKKNADVITEEMNKQIDHLIEKVTAKMSEIEASMSEDLAGGRKINEEQATKMRESLEALNTQLEALKADISEKIHSENVKCYRNVADLLKGLEDKMNKVSDVETKVSSVHKCVITVIVLTAINMLGLLALALYELGVFQMFLG